MPIEIKELHIRIAVNPSESGNAQPSTPSAPAQVSGAGDKEAIVAECVEQVLQILKEKRER